MQIGADIVEHSRSLRVWSRGGIRGWDPVVYRLRCASVRAGDDQFPADERAAHTRPTRWPRRLPTSTPGSCGHETGAVTVSKPRSLSPYHGIPDTHPCVTDLGPAVP